MTSLGAERPSGTLAAFLALVLSSAICVADESGQSKARFGAIRPWPCRVIVDPPLSNTFEKGWKQSETLRRQCEELAAMRAVVDLRWGAKDSEAHARAQLGVRDGVAVATLAVPPVTEVIELIAHEFQHVIEMGHGLDFEAEAKRPGSGVYRAFWGFETQAAIDAGRQVAKELRDAGRR